MELIFFFLAAGSLTLGLFAVSDVVQKPFKSKRFKIKWSLINLLLPILGPLLYFVFRPFLRRRKRRPMPMHH